MIIGAVERNQKRFLFCEAGLLMNVLETTYEAK
jgi:hypothetical protein